MINNDFFLIKLLKESAQLDVLVVLWQQDCCPAFRPRTGTFSFSQGVRGPASLLVIRGLGIWVFGCTHNHQLFFGAL